MLKEKRFNQKTKRFMVTGQQIKAVTHTCVTFTDTVTPRTDKTKVVLIESCPRCSSMCPPLMSFLLL
jgi:hypothetical protein